MKSLIMNFFKYCKVYSARNKNGWRRFIREKIERKPEITINEMAKQIGITEKGIEWQIKKLKKAEKLERIGKKGGYWEVMKEVLSLSKGGVEGRSRRGIKKGRK